MIEKRVYRVLLRCCECRETLLRLSIRAEFDEIEFELESERWVSSRNILRKMGFVFLSNTVVEG